jgi:hypothetical protein
VRLLDSNTCGAVPRLERVVSTTEQAEAWKGNAPGRMKAHGSQGGRTRRNPATTLPNRQRDKTPEARPLRQQCLKRRKRGKHQRSARDVSSTGMTHPMSS